MSRLKSLCLPVPSADIFCKQFGPRSSPGQNVGPDLEPNFLTSDVFLKDFFSKKVDFEIISMKNIIQWAKR